jgi:5'(3')-deoxyribonucleotidase
MMKIFDELTNRNFKLFAMQHYNNPECTDVEEFKEDLNRFRYLKRLLSRYEADGDLQERLILNHIIVIYNVFGIEAANRMIWFKLQKEHWTYVKPFLVFLNYLPIDEKVYVPLDPYIIDKLRNL